MFPETRQGPGEGLPNCSEVKLLAKSFDEETASACQRLHNTQMEKLNSFDQPLLGKLFFRMLAVRLEFLCQFPSF